MAVGSDETFSSLPLGATEGLQREDLTGAYTTAYKAAKQSRQSLTNSCSEALHRRTER